MLTMQQCDHLKDGDMFIAYSLQLYSQMKRITGITHENLVVVAETEIFMRGTWPSYCFNILQMLMVFHCRII